MSQATLFKNATLITMDRRRRILSGDMLFQNGLITAIGDIGSLPSDCSVVDASNKWIFPGFIQGHVHLCQMLFRNQAEGLSLLDWLQKKIWPLEAAHTAETIRTSVLVGLAEMIHFGTTTVLDMGTVKHTEEIFRAADEVGIRGFFGKTLMDQDSVPAYIREERVTAIQESLRLMDKWHNHDGGRLKYALAPRFVLSCTEKLWLELKEISKQNNIFIHTHAAENREETEFVKQLTGHGNIAYFHKLGLTGPLLAVAHCIWLDDNEIDILASTGTRVLHCPTTNLKLGSGVAHVKEFIDKGIPLLLGSDGAPANNQMSIMQEMKMALLLQLPPHGVTAITAEKIVSLATIESAMALGISDRVGSLEVGKEADFVLFDPAKISTVPVGDPYTTLVFSGGRENIEAVYVCGRALLQSGRLVTIDEEKLLLDATKAWESFKTDKG